VSKPVVHTVVNKSLPTFLYYDIKKAKKKKIPLQKRHDGYFSAGDRKERRGRAESIALTEKVGVPMNSAGYELG